jgi:membrane dipeptidase
MNLPVIDLHCDMLSYLQDKESPDPLNTEDIGCAFPWLEQGNVKLQVMAIYTATEKGSSAKGLQQSLVFKNLLTAYSDRIRPITAREELKSIPLNHPMGVLAAIENASGFCEENESLQAGYNKLETLLTNTGRILYLGLTHHGENRFGGGNTTSTGLKPDGERLLQHLNKRKIALDLAHASDALAFDCLEYITKFNLDIPVLASHSNFRTVFDHPRNLPDEIAKEIIHRKGLIGMNFLRAFLNNQNPDALFDHIRYGLQLGAAESLCFGADYFHTGKHPDTSRIPFYFPEHENASCYPFLLDKLSHQVPEQVIRGLAYQNALSFVERVWA